MKYKLLDSKSINQGSNDVFNETNKFNFGAAIVPDDRNKQLSVVGKFTPFFHHDHFITVNNHLEVESHSSSEINKEDFYYGISPLMDSSRIVSFLTNLSLSSKEDLEEEMKKNAYLYSFYEGMEEYIIPFIKYSILALSSLYGIRIKLTKEDIDNGFLNLIVAGKSFISFNKDSNVLTLKGCPTSETLKNLSSFRFIQNEEDKTFVISKDNEGVSFEDIYRKKMFSLVDGYVFYSGVLLNTVALKETSNSNFNVEAVEMLFEKTTYATVFCFTNNRLDHPYLSKSDVFSLSKLFCRDDKLLNELRDALRSDEVLSKASIIAHINHYLKETYEPNQIGISGNLLTKDKILVLGKRSGGSIDSDSIYPGINGNAEIKDDNVEFYNESVNEDFPSIDINSKRIDFNGELSREGYAELQIDLPLNKWKYSAISLSGNACDISEVNEETYEGYVEAFKERRLHFNVIASQSTELSFLDVLGKQKGATESYENGSLYGWRLIASNSLLKFFFKNCVWKIIQVVLKNKNAVSSLITCGTAIFLLFGMNFIEGMQKYATVTMLFTVLSAIVAAVSFVSFVMAMFTLIKNSKTKVIIKNNVVRSNEEGSCNTINKSIFNLLRNKKRKDNNKIHPASYFSIKVFADQIVYKEFKNKKKRSKR